jgi:biotin carboxyl carrier protein
MKLALDIKGRTIDVDFRTADGRAEFTHDGQRRAAEVSEPEPGLYVITIGARIYRCTIDRLSTGGTEIIVNGRRIPVEIIDPKRARSRANSVGGASGRAVLTAPMAGKVVRLICAVDDEVVAEAGVLVVEAMKMQNEVQSPKAGRVVEIRVAEGQTVNAGEVLAIIE